MKSRVFLIVVAVLMALCGRAAATDVDSLHLYYVHQYQDGVDDGYWFGAELQGTDVTYSDISIGGEVTHQLNGYGNFYAHYSDEYATKADMLSDYPTGSWCFAWAGEGFNTGITMQTNNNEPAGIASIDSIGNSTNPTFEWSFNPNHGTALTADIFNVDTEELVYTQRWTDISTAATNWTPGDLEEGNYELVVGIWNVNFEFGCVVSPAYDDFMTFSSFGALNSVEFTVVPEPATICLLGIGGIALLRRRK